ncbi:MAG: NUDIX domain-containing protein [Cytophagales bacterium]|nr:NUDIX domain-containing protein [Cytophagales bacterium]
MKGTGVIIARFQTPYLHEGHISLIEQTQNKHQKVVIVLGVSPLSGSRRNPYDFHTREKMLKKSFPDVIVLPLADHPSDTQWSKDLDRLLKTTFNNGQFTLYGSRDSFINYYSGSLETLEIPAKGDFNATAIRQQYADKVSDSEDFRGGIIYGLYNTYTKVYPTVDMAVFRNERTEILLGKKSINNKWRFIGGFVDPTDGSYEEAAIRELQEEAGNIETANVNYEASFKIDDWRYRSESDKIITIFYGADYVFGTPTASDDIAEVQWIKIADLPKLLEDGETTPEHIDLFNHIIKKYNN